MSIASALDLIVDDAAVLQNSNKLAVRLRPCDVLARVAPLGRYVAQFEIELAQRLAETDSPVAVLEPRAPPRAYEHDGFVVTLWTVYEPLTPPGLAPDDYAKALEQLHAGMRKLDVTTPHFTDRVAEAQQIVANRDQSPALADADRELLGSSLSSLRRTIADRVEAEQLLHGEPHPGNVLDTKDGPLFIDMQVETCCRGPPSRSTSPTRPKTSPGTIRALIKTCSARAGASCWRWSRRGAGMRAISSRTGDEKAENSSAFYARDRRGARCFDAATGGSVS